MVVHIACDPVSLASLGLPRPLASLCGLASCYRSIEDVFVRAVVIPKLKFRDVERHVFAAHLSVFLKQED